MLLLCLAGPVLSDPVRIGYWHSELSAKGPGVLLRDIRRGTPRIAAAAQAIAKLDADILVLGGVDYDHAQATLTALAGTATAAGAPEYPHLFARRPNTGMDTGLDMDGDGRMGRARDMQGFATFAGQGGMAVLSRWPVTLIADHSARLWRDMPDSLLIDAKGRRGAAATGADVQRMSTTVHWELRVTPPGAAPLTLMILHATPPVFDGPEDRNGRRNADEALFFLHRLDGAFGPPPGEPFVILGTFNLDPDAGDGHRAVMRQVLSDPRLADPPALAGRPTADFPSPGPGAMRVDYILPSGSLTITGAARLTPGADTGRHLPLWVGLDVPDQAAAN